MPVLSLENVEKHVQDTILFPLFNLKVFKGDIATIHSNLNIRNALLDILIGKSAMSSGKVTINGISTTGNKANYLLDTGILFFEEGLYERLTVIDHFKFYKGIFESEQRTDELLVLTQLEAKKNIKVGKLSFSEKKRVQFARLLFQNPSLFILEEPDLNVDVETKRIFINIIELLKKEGKSLLVLTGNMESAITIADCVYRLDETGLEKIEVQTGEDEAEIVVADEMPVLFDKIPTKVNDKIVLFDPPEIDFIESHDGQSNLHIKGESFPCVFTLSDLEERLRPFGFFRCHRSYIVNLQRVREVITWTRNSFNLILDNQEKSSIPLSKAKMAQLKDMLGLK